MRGNWQLLWVGIFPLTWREIPTLASFPLGMLGTALAFLLSRRQRRLRAAMTAELRFALAILHCVLMYELYFKLLFIDFELF